MPAGYKSRNGSHQAKTKVLAGLRSFLEAFWYNLLFCLFQLPDAAWIPSLTCHLHSYWWLSESFSHFTTLILTVLPSSSTWKEPLHWVMSIILDNLFNVKPAVSNVNSSLPGNITDLQFLGLKTWTSLGVGIILPTTTPWHLLLLIGLTSSMD